MLLRVLTGKRLGPNYQHRETCRRLIIWAASESALTALKDGQLLSLGAFERTGKVWISGRIRKEHLATLLGIDELPVVMAKEPLARLILEGCTLARPQESATRCPGKGKENSMDTSGSKGSH